MSNVSAVLKVAQYRTAILEFTYKNHRGETSRRRVRPSYIAFEATEWHPDPQWILWGMDLDKRMSRGFAMKDITDVRSTPVQE